MSYLTHLECSECGKTYPAEVLQNTCGCGGTLFTRYNLEQMRREIMRDEVSAGPASLWRYASVLPAQNTDKIISQGEGWTPMLRARGIERSLGCENLYIKNEGTNPTGTFKDRGTSVALTRAGELGAPTVILNSSGNAGISWAAYAAQAKVPCVTVLPFDAPPSTVRFCRNMGARVFEARGPWAEAGPMVQEAAEKNGWFSVNTLKEPYRVEGKKTMGYEIAEQLGWTLPDVIFYPTGGGTGVIAIWKAFDELRELGWVEGPTPRLVVTQYEGCAPIVRAHREGKEQHAPWGEIDIIPGGLKSPNPPGGKQVLGLLRRTEGAAIAVSKTETFEASAVLGKEEGLVACPEGATTLAGLRRALAEGIVRPHERVVLMNTGSGLRYGDALPEAEAIPVEAGGSLPVER